MPAATRVSLSGVREVQQALDRLPAIVVERVQGPGLEAAAEVVRRTARNNAPVRTGALRNSIIAVRQAAFLRGQKIRNGAAVVFAGGNRAPHANIVEHGSVRVPATPFLEPALFGTASTQLNAAADEMRRQFNRVPRQLVSGSSSPRARVLTTA